MTRRIVTYVVICHFIALGAIVLTGTPPKLIPTNKILVRQVRQARLVEPKPQPQPQIAKADAKPKPAPKKIVKKPGPNNERLKQAAASLANLDLSYEKPTTAVPQITAAPVKEKTQYSAELSQRLKLALKLPEYGDVRVALTLNRGGKVIDVKIVESHSQINREYALKVLPTLSFLPFGKEFPGQEQHTFPVVLSNAF